MDNIKDFFDCTIPVVRVGSLYAYKRIWGSNNVLCYCSNCNKADIEISISKLEYSLRHNVNITCGCKLNKQDKGKSLLHIGDSFSKLTIVKKLDNKKYECLCDCGNLIIVDEKELKNNDTVECNNCMSKDVNQYEKLYNQKIIKELYYIWSSYLYLYNNPSKSFQYKILDKKIKFFPEFNNKFELFYKWAISTNYRKEGIYMEREDNKEDFTSENCIWNYTDKSKLIDLPKSVLKNSIDERAEGTQQSLEIAKVENKKEVRESRERLFNYFYTHYGIRYIPKSIETLLKQLNNGINKKYQNVQISYSKMYNMLIYYKNKLFGLYKEKVKRNKLKNPVERIYYEIAVIVSLVDDYDNRMATVHNLGNNVKVDGGESLQDFSIYFQYKVPRKNERDQKKLDEMDEIVEEFLKDMEEEKNNNSNDNDNV